MSWASRPENGSLRGWLILRRGCLLFRDLEEGEKHNQHLVNKHFVQIDQWEQAVRLVIYEQEREF